MIPPERPRPWPYSSTGVPRSPDSAPGPHRPGARAGTVKTAACAADVRQHHGHQAPRRRASPSIRDCRHWPAHNVPPHRPIRAEFCHIRAGNTSARAHAGGRHAFRPRTRIDASPRQTPLARSSTYARPDSLLAPYLLAQRRVMPYQPHKVVKLRHCQTRTFDRTDSPGLAHWRNLSATLSLWVSCTRERHVLGYFTACLTCNRSHRGTVR